MLEITVSRNKKKKDLLGVVEKKLLELEKSKISAGFFSESKYPLSSRAKGKPVAMIAVWNNDGTPTIPSRAFMDKATLNMPDNSEFKMLLEQPVIKAMTGVGVNASQKRVGEKMKEMIKEEILNTKIPSNEPSTISKKGFDDPLIETGLMYDSVKSKVRKVK